MPTYEYVCDVCGGGWETEQRITEPPLKKCPKCGKNAAKRQISGGGAFILKGGGWYADGYSGSRSSSPTPSTCERKCETCEVKSTPSSGKKASGDGGSKPASPSKSGDAKVSAA
jgi:putative FmdB family regulatory protein